MSILSNFTAYVKQVWANRPTLTSPLSAARLNHMEAGIKANSDAVEAISNAVISNIINDPNKIASMATAYALQQQITKLNSDWNSHKREDIFSKLGTSTSKSDFTVKNHDRADYLVIIQEYAAPNTTVANATICLLTIECKRSTPSVGFKVLSGDRNSLLPSAATVSGGDTTNDEYITLTLEFPVDTFRIISISLLACNN